MCMLQNASPCNAVRRVGSAAGARRRSAKTGCLSPGEGLVNLAHQKTPVYPVNLLPFRRTSPSCVLSFAAGALLAAFSAQATPVLTTIHTFDSDTDGNTPFAELTEGADGKFYGTTTTGGKNDNGTVFSVERNGSGFVVLSAFPGTSAASNPQGGVAQARDGNFYGTTYSGGANGYGSLFQVTPGGTLTLLTSFTNGDPGGNPSSTLLEGVDGFLYGTAEYGGLDNFGTVFKTTVPSGASVTLTTFEGGLDGEYPQSDLIQARDGNFYGTTDTGGTDNYGTFFQVTPAGVRTILYNFTNGTDGSFPLRGVIQGADGYFYGIAENGGGGEGGVIYRIALSGTTATLTPLYDFTETPGNAYTSYGRLVQASDGNFYGTTNGGGASDAGTVFEMTPGGAFTLLYNFTNADDGGYPDAGLIQGSDGKLYGTTAGYEGSAGTIFKIDLGLAVPAPLPNLFTPTTASAGNTIEIEGNQFLGTSAVSFIGPNGTPIPAASFTVASNTSIAAVVPSGAATGVISVTANGLTGSTPISLTISGGGTTPPPVSGTTTVGVVASDPVATFAGSDTGRFRLSRSGDLSQALTVIFKIVGTSTAVRGTDYNLVVEGDTLAPITNSITIPAGHKNIGIKVVPIQSATPRPDETVIFKVKAGGGYTLESSVKAEVLIAGDE